MIATEKAPMHGAFSFSSHVSERYGPWAVALALTLLTLIPVAVVASAMLHPDQAIWDHLWRHVIPELLVNTFFLAIGVGLGGVLIVLRPDAARMASLGSIAVLVAAAAYSLSAITVRALGRTDSTQSMVFWMLSSMALGAGLIALPSWVPVRSEHWLLIAGIGAAGALGQYAITEAFSRGEASVIAPFEYTALGWGVALDLALWGVLPDRITWLGAGIIVASGLYLMRREAAVPGGSDSATRAPCESGLP